MRLVFSDLFSGHLGLWFFSVICKLMTPQQHPPKDRHHEKPETSTHRGASLQLPRREPRLLGKLVCKKVFVGVFLGHLWFFMHSQCCELGLQRLSNIYLPEIVATGMEFAEGGGMFDLLSKQLFLKSWRSSILLYFWWDIFWDYMGYIDGILMGYTFDGIHIPYNPMALWQLLLLLSYWPVREHICSPSRPVLLHRIQVWQVHLWARSSTFLRSLWCLGVLAHPNAADYSQAQPWQ